MLLTKEQLHLMMPNASKSNIDKFLLPLNAAMEEFKIVKPLQIAAFIAQLAHESGSFHYVEEIASGSNYEFRKDLGNLEFEALQAAHAKHSTSGKFYKGRGLIQITGYYNYKACGTALKVDLITNPKLLSEEVYACRSAAWFWHSRSLNSYADLGKFSNITKLINGGTNGSTERLANYARCKKILEC